MMYANKIKIDYIPKKVPTLKEVELPDRLLTLNDISKYLKEGDKFSFQEKEVGSYGTSIFLNIYGVRFETKKELKDRVAKEEKYNENYEKHWVKYSK